VFRLRWYRLYNAEGHAAECEPDGDSIADGKRVADSDCSSHSDGIGKHVADSNPAPVRDSLS
jgi:hypothetical protein